MGEAPCKIMSILMAYLATFNKNIWCITVKACLVKNATGKSLNKFICNEPHIFVKNVKFSYSPSARRI